MTKRARKNDDLTAGPAFFVVGFSRSGTTIFASLLDRHSEICVPPETLFCHGVLPAGRPVFDIRDHDSIEARVFAYWRIPDLEVSRTEFAKEFRRVEATYANAFSCLLELFRRKTGAKLLGEKSPIHLHYVRTLFKWFPDTRVFCLTRDGRDVVESLVDAPFTHKNRLRHAAEWAYQSKLSRDALHAFPDRFSVVRFEDLLRDAPATLKSVCEKVGVSFEPQQLDPVGDSAVVPEWEQAWKKQSLAAIDDSKVALWKTRDLGSFQNLVAWHIMSKELLAWGYEIPRQAGSRRLTSVAAWCTSLLYRGRFYRIMRRVSQETKILLHRLGIRKHL